MERAQPIRAVSRSIAVLQLINREGSVAAMQVARQVGLPYPTTFRIIQTLVHEGLLAFDAATRHYRVTELVQSLSSGDAGSSRQLQAAARPHMVALTSRLSWPVSLTTHVGRHMMVRDSTHTLSSLTFFNCPPGYTLPLLECASGHVYLAHLGEQPRAALLSGLAAAQPRPPGLALFQNARLLDNIVQRGCATWERNPHGQSPGKTSSIAVPVFDAGGITAALTLVFFASAMPMSEALARYADELKAAAQAISRALGAPVAGATPAASAASMPGQQAPLQAAAACGRVAAVPG